MDGLMDGEMGEWMGGRIAAHVKDESMDDCGWIDRHDKSFANPILTQPFPYLPPRLNSKHHPLDCLPA